MIVHELTHTVQQSGSKGYTDQDAWRGDSLLFEDQNIDRHIQTSTLQPIRRQINPPIITRQLSPELCSPDCEVPDGKDEPPHKCLLIVYADKEGSFMLIPKTSKVGHSWLKLVDTDGNYWTYGFWPQRGFNPANPKADVEGCVHHPDIAHTPTASQTFELTAEEFAAAKAKARTICEIKPKYNVFGLQCTAFVGQVLAAAGKRPALGFGLIWDSPNALDSWIRGNALLLGISYTGATSAPGKQGLGNVGVDIMYKDQFYSLLGNKLRLYWMSRGELSSRMATVSTGVSAEVTSQRVFLPSFYVFGGGTAGKLSPEVELTGKGAYFGAGVSGGAGISYRIDEIATVGVEYNVVKDLVTRDPALQRLMVSASIQLF